MANIKNQLELIQEAVWQYTGYDGNNIDIFLENWDLDVHLCSYVGDEEHPVPKEYTDTFYLVAVLPEPKMIHVRECVPTKPAKAIHM